MNIEFEFDRKYQISLIHNIPDAPRLKLLGYNGIGKTLTANILASISGELVWTSKERIKILANFLPNFIVKINLNGNTYRIESKINNWRIDPVSGKLEPESIGTILLNGSDVTFDKFWSQFKCYIVRGNEDINSQIETLAIKFKRIILFQINNLEKPFTNFRKELNDVQTLLTQEGLCYDILTNEELLDSFDTEEKDFPPIDALEGLLSGLKKVKNKDWLSLTSISESLNKLLAFKKQIKIELEKNKLEIAKLKQRIPKDQEKNVENLIKTLNEFEQKRESLEFPLSKDKYSNKPSADKGKLEIINKISEKEKSAKEFEEDNFRKLYWSDALTNLNYELTERELDSDIEVLLEVDNKSSLSAKELEIWHNESVMISKEKLEKIGNYKEIKEEILELEEIANKFDDHIEKLEEWSRIGKDIKTVQAELNRSLRSLEDIQNLPAIEKRYGKLEAEFSAIVFIESHITNLIEFEEWSDIFGKDESPKIKDGFIESLENKIKKVKETATTKGQLENDKDEYIKNLKRPDVKSRMPTFIRRLIEEGKIVSLCKIGSTLSKHQIQAPILKYLEDECRITIDGFVKNQDTKQSEQASFITGLNEYLGRKITSLLNMDAFKEHVFSNNEVISVNPQENILRYKDKKGKTYKKFIADYSTGEKAFAYSMASIVNAISSSTVENSMLILDEFGAMLAEDKEQFLIDSLNNLQEEKNWPTQYIIVLPYKGEFERKEYSERLGTEITQLKNSLKEHGYAFEKIQILY